jgi:ComF family protein
VKLSSWAQDLLDLLLPPGCVACGTWLPGGRSAPLVCGPCRSRLRVAPWPRCPRCHWPLGARRVAAPDCLECRAWSPSLSAARYVHVLAPPADDLIHALKYEGWSELAGTMGEAMSRLAAPRASPRAVVVPVPTTPRRLRARGYNQAELLARSLADARRLPLTAALERRGEGDSQTSLAPTERKENVRGAFRARRSARANVAGADVLLVDDVLTTGATASEAAGALAELDPASVTLVAFARALP